MNHNPVWNSIARHLSGEVKEEDKLLIKEWLSRDFLNREVLTHLEMVWNDRPETGDSVLNVYQLYQNKKALHREKKRRGGFIRLSLKIAAGLTILIASTFLFYLFFPAEVSDEVTLQEVVIPAGNRALVVLPDSTVVWLSNNSRIVYPSRFDKGSREVELSGNAYFEVFHDQEARFYVHLGNSRIEVLGTKFSVTAYPGDSLISAGLLEGKIQLVVQDPEDEEKSNYYELDPLSCIVYDKLSGAVKRSAVQEDFFDYWKTGTLFFKNERLDELAIKIERVLNVKIVFMDDFIRDKRFNGVLGPDDNIHTFMDAIIKTSVDPIAYKLEEDTIFIKRGS